MKQPKIACPTCNGEGEVLLSDGLFKTLELLKSLKHASPADLWRASKEKVHATAFNNRMDDLFTLGLVTRVKDGKAWR